MCRYKNIILNLRKASHRITVNTTSVYLWGSKSLFSYAQGAQFSLAEFVKEKEKMSTCQKSKYLHINLTSALRNK